MMPAMFFLLLLQTAPPAPAPPSIGSVFVSNLPSIIAALAAAGVLWRGQQKEAARSELAAAQRKELGQDIKDTKEETRVIRTQTDGNYTRLETKLAVTEKEVMLLKDQVIILNRLVSKNDLDAANRSRDASETAALEVYQELVDTRAKLAALEARQEANRGGNPA